MRAMHRVPLAPKEAALSRACRIWQCRAAIDRGDRRREGVHGPLRTLDEIASGQRGKAAPKGIAMWAMELYAAGASTEEVTTRVTETARLIALAVRADGPDAA